MSWPAPRDRLDATIGVDARRFGQRVFGPLTLLRGNIREKGITSVTDPLGFSATLAAALILGLPFVQSSTAPSAEERRLVDYVDAHAGDALALLERVVNINSGTQNFDGVREVGRIFSAELESLGFSTRWVDGAAFHRAGHLVAEHRGSGPRILLIGHLDTVFEKDSPFQKFERIDERSGRGPGIIDMKGGDVVMVSALKALHAAGALEAMNLAVVLTGDEEDSGRPLMLARQALVVRGGRRPGRDWIRERTRRSKARGHRAARHHRLAGERHRHACALVADLPRGRRLRRGLRSRSHHQCVPRADGRGGPPDVQPRRAPRRHDGRVRSGADARQRVRQDERRG